MKNFNPLGKGKQAEKTAVQNLYNTLGAEKYTHYPYEKQCLDDDMYVINQAIGEYWKPRYLVDEKNKTAVEFMDRWTTLQTVCTDDIDWKSLESLSQEVINKAKDLNAVFPTFVRDYKNGVAKVSWQINPDGHYYMDENGYGMTDDKEITIYSYVDKTGKPLIKFRIIKDFNELKMMEKEAIKNLKTIR
ncbi:MAG: hypothetical protein J5996_02190 [Prevotella sp.]|nr:hypothetical protein [Prevotella sp.]